MDLLELICYLVAFILFILAGVGVTVSRVNLIALGLAAFVLPFLAHAIKVIS